MLNTIGKIALVLSLAIGVVACKGMTTHPILNVHDAVIPQGLSAAEVRGGILAAGIGRNWAMNEIRAGVIRGEVLVRQHRATIEITYDQSEFNIDYVDSENLDAGPGTIHRNYNRWIANLERDIRLELSRIAADQ